MHNSNIVNIVLLVIVLHLSWAFLMIFHGGPLQTTTISTTLQLFGDYRTASFLYLASAFSAILGLYFVWHKQPVLGLLLILPQQFLLFLALEGAILAVFNSSFADGVMRPRSFILADQMYAILLGAWHTFRLTHYYGQFITKKL